MANKKRYGKRKFRTKVSIGKTTPEVFLKNPITYAPRNPITKFVLQETYFLTPAQLNALNLLRFEMTAIQSPSAINGTWTRNGTTNAWPPLGYDFFHGKYSQYVVKGAKLSAHFMPEDGSDIQQHLFCAIGDSANAAAYTASLSVDDIERSQNVKRRIIMANTNHIKNCIIKGFYSPKHVGVRDALQSSQIHVNPTGGVSDSVLTGPGDKNAHYLWLMYKGYKTSGLNPPPQVCVRVIVEYVVQWIERGAAATGPLAEEMGG